MNTDKLMDHEIKVYQLYQPQHPYLKLLLECKSNKIKLKMARDFIKNVKVCGEWGCNYDPTEILNKIK